MHTFKTNKIFLNKETVAEQLRSTRQAKGCNLGTAAKELKINFEYLQALETGDFAKLPKGIYSLNFLREYAEFLELDYGKLRQKFLSEQEVYQSQKQQKLFSRQIVKKKYFLEVPRFIKGMLLVLVALVCLLYIVWLLKNVFVPPSLEVLSPKQNLVTTDTVILVSGNTEPETEVLINQGQIMVDDNGRFEKEINLKQGINSIVITAQRGNKDSTIVREVLVKSILE